MVSVTFPGNFKVVIRLLVIEKNVIVYALKLAASVKVNSLNRSMSWLHDITITRQYDKYKNFSSYLLFEI